MFDGDVPVAVFEVCQQDVPVNHSLLLNSCIQLHLLRVAHQEYSSPVVVLKLLLCSFFISSETL